MAAHFLVAAFYALSHERTDRYVQTERERERERQAEYKTNDWKEYC